VDGVVDGVTDGFADWGACVLFEFAPAAGIMVPAAGAGGEIVVPGVAGASTAGVAGVPPDDAPGSGAGLGGMEAAGVDDSVRAGGLGMYSGPVWPQADSKLSVARAARAGTAAGSANGDFTIRITV
jgi:hypothetical protein